jgi:hypothetical protein
VFAAMLLISGLISGVMQLISIMAIAASKMVRIGPSFEDAASAYGPRNLVLNLSLPSYAARSSRASVGRFRVGSNSRGLVAGAENPQV